MLGQKEIFRRKRDVLCNALEATGFPICRPSGAIYVLADVSRLGCADAVAANIKLIKELKVGAVPAHGFYADDTGKQQLRFCFAVKDELLEESARRLRSI